MNDWLSRTMFLLMIFACFILSMVTADAQVNSLESLSSKTYSTRHGIPSNVVWDIIQDRYGFVWIASVQGISCYDGQEFINYTEFPQQNSLEVYKILQDSKDSFWLATKSGLVLMQNGRFITMKLGSSEEQLPITDIIEDKSSNVIYVLIDGKQLFSINKYHPELLLPSPENPVNQIYSLNQDLQNNCYVCTDKGIFKINKDDLEPFQIDTPANLKPFRILFGENSKFWIVAEKDMIAYYQDSILVDFIDLKLNTRIYDIIFNPGSGVWLGTTKGLFLWRDNELSHFTVNNGISSNLIYCLFVDREGSLWYGSDNGLGKILGMKFRRLIPSRDLPISSIMDLEISKDGTIWIGSSEGIVRLNDNIPKIFSFEEGLKDDYITSICVTDNNRVYAAALDGLYLLNKNKKFEKLISRSNLIVHDIVEDTSSRLWLATENGIFTLDNNQMTDRSDQMSLPSETAYTFVHDDGTGSLWIGTQSNGLFIHTGNETIHYEDLPSDEIYCIDQIDSANFWIGTSDGACLIDRYSLQKHLSEKDGLKSPNVWTVQHDTNGSIWMATSKGLYCYKERRLYNYDVDDGLSSDDFTANCRLVDRHMRIWFGGSGVTIVDPRDPNLFVQPVIYLKSAYANDGPIKFGDRLEHHNNSVEFSFVCVSFINENRNQYRFQLQGFDKQRSQLTSNPIIRYTNLPTGEYKLVAEAVNRDGFSTAESAVFSFEIMPSFFEIYWVQAGIGIFMISLIWAMARIRNVRIRARARWLQTEVDRQTEIIKKQLDEIAQQRDRLELLATTDDLTTLHNRRYFFRALQNEWKRHERYMRPISIILFDVDHFKSFNDTYGHAMGDEVLIAVAKTLQAQIRSTDTLARFGGEEFILLLPETEQEVAFEVAERIRMELAKMKLKFGSMEISGVNVSGGVSTKRASMGAFNPDSLIHQADIAMYRAKEAGRNRIIQYTDD